MNKLMLIAIVAPICLMAWDSDRENDEDRRDSQFDKTRNCKCDGYDWSKLDRSKDQDVDLDRESRGTIPGPDDSKD